MGKDEKDQAGNVILKTVAVGGAAAVGALGTMAFMKHDGETNNGGESESDDNRMSGVRSQMMDDIVDDVKVGEDESREGLRSELVGEESVSRPSSRESHRDIERPHYDDRVDNNPHDFSGDMDDEDDMNTGHEVEVVDYQTLDDIDGDEVNVAVVKVDGTHVALVDVDGDMNADLLIVDSDGNEVFDEGDAIHDITNKDIDMQEFRDALNPDEDLIVDGDDADFNNDANVDDFIS